MAEQSQVSTITTTTSAASYTPTDGRASWLTRPITPTIDVHGNIVQCIRQSKTCREVRQSRMFKAVLALMIIFLLCRMPTWIYLLIKMYNVSNTNAMWMLHFCLGLLSVTSCVLNPFLYTFLMETIQYSGRFLECLERIVCFYRQRPRKGESGWR